MGPLADLKIVEFAGLGPAPMCAMLLADLGARVLRIDRTAEVELGMKRPLALNLLNRSRDDIALDLKNPRAAALALEIVADADMLIEGFRPGVMERLGLGPDVCLARNQRLIYGRMTGFGQSGPLAGAAGHDLNYIALTGALDAVGRPGQPPTPALNLVGDFGGGSLYLAMGMLAALHEARRSGHGQVVDSAIVDGALSLMTMHYGSLAAGLWRHPRAENGTACFYEVYECADGKWVSVAAVERRFFEILLAKLGIDAALVPDHRDRSRWPAVHRLLADRFRQRSRDEWCELLEGSDACFTPVLDMNEVRHHPHMAAREAIIEVDGVPQPAPAPRFSRSVPPLPRAPKAVTRDEALHTLETWFGHERHAALATAGVLDVVAGSPAGA